MKVKDSVVTYIEMNDPAELNAVTTDRTDVKIVHAQIPVPELNRFFYATVGANFNWVDRLVWSPEQWKAWADRDNFQTWIFYVSGSPAGYCELEKIDNEVEIVHFGLLPSFHGQGLGGYCLSEMIKNAWNWNAKRVWLHTCDFDHDAALPNYLKRGFRVYKEEIVRQKYQ